MRNPVSVINTPMSSLLIHCLSSNTNRNALLMSMIILLSLSATELYAWGSERLQQ